MLELVPQHLIPSYWSTHLKAMTLERNDWKTIGKKLNRAPGDCGSKYNLIKQREMKKGHFTAEEDALICKRVEEWGDKGNGLWVALEKEMDRPGKLISERWRLTLSRRQ